LRTPFFYTFVKQFNFIHMAQYNPSIALGQLKGKIGGTVFQGGNNSSIIRNKTYKKGAGSLVRSLATSNIITYAAQWRTLSPADQNSYKTLALTYPFINKFGIIYFGSAYQVFVSINTFALRNGLGPYIPAPTAVAPTNIAPWLTPTISTVAMVVNWSHAGISGEFIRLYASRTMSAGRNNNHPKLIYIGDYDINGITAIDIISDYKTKVGDTITAQKYIIKGVVYNRVYPYPYYPAIMSGICT